MATFAPPAPVVAQARVGAVLQAPAREALIERALAAYSGGLRILILPVSIPFVAEIAAEISDHADDLIVGIGDVVDAEHVNIALAAGASFALFSALDEELEKTAQDRGLIVIPGVATPSELRIARSRTKGLVACYPVGYLGGARYFGRLAKIQPDLPLVAMGHIGPDDAPAYLEMGANVVIVDHGLFPTDDDPASEEVIAMRAGALVEVCGDIVPGRPSHP
jgi:2-dehydro-3-deoxyphosphogluconate aldolase/(4S)-4-hydroxy-2-oxoglutarate aldolase